jgi:acetyltransferase
MNTPTIHAEPVTDVFRKCEPNQLDAIFSPKTIAIIGASEKPDCVGRTLVENLELIS